MGNNPGLKFPLRADGDFIIQPDDKALCFVGGVLARCGPAPIAAELVRLANLAHEAEAVLNLALEGMFHANGCALNPANVNNCECGHSTLNHYKFSDFCFYERHDCLCRKYKRAEPRCSCGTAEATQQINTLLQKYGANHG